MPPVTVIAEIGINHGGDMDLAQKMIALSKWAGADIAKFQWYRPEEILGRDSPYLAEAKKAQFSKDEHKELKAYCDKLGIEWGCSIFHPDLVSATEDLGIKRYKVASRSIKYEGLLHEINRTEKPVIVSTGNATLNEIVKAIQILNDCDVTLLYCVCDYPTALSKINLGYMQRLGNYSTKFGFSSHCPRISPTLAAVARGATVTENHVVVGRGVGVQGCDVPSSLDFNEFKEMVGHIRDLEQLA